jgi:hypothetical protein
MPPLRDDDTIDPDQSLIRALRPGWTTAKDGTERPNSLAFTDETQETSCFFDNEANLTELRRQFPGVKICRFRASVVRAANFVIERKPADCPEGFPDPTHHVVIGPSETISRKQLMKIGHKIANTPGIEVLQPCGLEIFPI